MKVLLTGGSGNLGQTLVPKLLDPGTRTQLRQFAVTIAVRSCWLSVSVKTEPIEVT